MNFTLSQCKALLDEAMGGCGAFRWGVAAAEPVDDATIVRFHRWLDEGKNASMDYLGRYLELRSDPRLLLPGAKSIVVALFSYRTKSIPEPSLPQFARYALGDDYHEVLRQKLTDVVATLKAELGGDYRICVDTAPLFERYWAVKAGLGFVGRNHQLISPDAGSMFFIASFLSTVEFPADEPCVAGCADCRRCVAACPGGALRPDGSFDSRRCLSYLTIEHRGDFPDEVDLVNHVYGCDECQNVCPHNCKAIDVDALPEFEPRPFFSTLTRERIITMSQEEFSAYFRHSAIKRAKLIGIQRNVRHIEPLH